MGRRHHEARRDRAKYWQLLRIYLTKQPWDCESEHDQNSRDALPEDCKRIMYNDFANRHCQDALLLHVSQRMQCF